MQDTSDEILIRKRSPNTTFTLLDIPIGSVLEFFKDPNIVCVTVDNKNKVKYNNKEMSISALAEKLLPAKSANGFLWFNFHGKPLDEIRKEKM